jgi:hypothetical protein
MKGRSPQFGPSAAKEFRKELGGLLTGISQGRRNLRETFESFVLLTACACSAGNREEEYLREIARWDTESQSLFPKCFELLVACMEAEPLQDMLGPIYMELGSASTQKWGGEFYTPLSVGKLMARMTLGDFKVPIDRPLSFCEPACGSGGMILAAAETMIERGYSPLNMEVTCVDVSKLACDMCYVNLTLSGIPAQVIHGNTLSLECWGGWRTVTWPMRRGQLAGKELELFRLLTSVTEVAAKIEASQPVVIPDFEQVAIVEAVEAATNSEGQMELFGEVAA